MDHSAAEEGTADSKSDYDAQRELIQSICGDKSIEEHMRKSGTFLFPVSNKSWSSTAAVAANEVSCLCLVVLTAYSFIPRCQSIGVA